MIKKNAQAGQPYKYQSIKSQLNKTFDVNGSLCLVADSCPVVGLKFNKTVQARPGAAPPNA